MSAEENKALAHRAWDAVDPDDLSAIDEVYAADCLIHETDQDLRGTEALKRYVSTFFEGFPDMSITVEDAIAEGDKVVTRMKARGTHTGEFMGIPPTGKRVEVAGITVHRVEGGKIAEEWEVFDAMGMMQQLGVVPSPEQEQQQQSGGTLSSGQEPTY